MDNKEPCKACGATNYYFWRMVQMGDQQYEKCSECDNGPMPSLSPDVYFDASKGAFQTDPNICDRYTGPIPFSSKREKAAILKRLRLREAGDRVHGSKNFDRHAAKQWDKFKKI